MEALKILKEKGWYLTNDGIKKVDAGLTQTKDIKGIIASVINLDFRDIAGGALPTKRDDLISGRIVLQLQKTRNISAPKSNEECKSAPRFLQLELTDGQTTIQALELENIPSLSLNLPPGTKIYFRAEKLQLMGGFLILRGSEIEVLGGNVEPLVEKWELARTMQKYARGGHRINSANGPPPWIAFGKKLDLPTTDQANFKSLQAGGADGKESKENEEFNAMRNEAIAEATKAGTKKVFGGGGQQMIDHNIKKILEKGYSEDDAKQALRTTNNNLERALYNLKRRVGDKRADDFANYKNTPSSYVSTKISGRNVGSKEMSGGKRGPSNFKEEATCAKPMANVSLYDFLTDKLSTDTTAATLSKNTAVSSPSTLVADAPSGAPTRSKSEFPKTQADKASNYNSYSKFENNMSSSFAANRSIEKGKPRIEADNFNNNRARLNNDRIQDSLNSNNDRINKSSNQNHIIRKNRQIPERPMVNPKELPSSVEVENSNYVKKRSTSPRRNRAVEERYDAYSRGKSLYKKNDQAMRVNKLVDATSKLQISGEEPKGLSKTSKGVYNLHQKRVNVQDSSQYFTPSTSNSNGLQYDTSKIIGFQNKEINEMAMTLLKSQNVDASNVSEKKQLQQSSPSQLSTNEQFSGTYMQPVAPHMQGSTYVAPVTAYVVPNPQAVQTVPTIPSHFGMVPGDAWNWKIGDICFAKYWDDGRYYEAEVTAVSEKTCVVFFLGYGNHEEVLKSDCLPITDGNHCPVNTHNTEGQQRQQQHPITATRPYQSQQMQMESLSRGGSSHRLRSERQVYVPPPKRDN